MYTQLPDSKVDEQCYDVFYRGLDSVVSCALLRTKLIPFSSRKSLKRYAAMLRDTAS
jgi:hypothetical protein